MRGDWSSLTAPLSIAAVVIFMLWAAIVRPLQARENVAMKVLEIYRLELEAGIKKKDSNALSLLETLDEANKTKEHDDGNDQR